MDKIKSRCISLESPSEWKEALKGINHSFAHTWENCYAMNLTTGYNTYLYCFEKDEIKIRPQSRKNEILGKLKKGYHYDIVLVKPNSARKTFFLRQ